MSWEQMVTMVAQPCKETKHHSAVHLKGKDFTICGLYFKTVPKKRVVAK